MKFRVNKIKTKIWSLYEEKKETQEYFEFIDGNLSKKVNSFYQDDFVLSTPIEESEIKFVTYKNQDLEKILIRRIIPKSCERDAIILPEDLSLSKILIYTDRIFSFEENVILELTLRSKINLMCKVVHSAPASRVLRKKGKFQKKYCVTLEIFKHFSSDFYLLKNEYPKIFSNSYNQRELR